MEQLSRIDEHVLKKQKSLRPLHEFLEEEQEPFLLEEFLLARSYSNKRFHSNPIGNLFKETSRGFSKNIFENKKPKVVSHEGLQCNGADSARCSLEMNAKESKKRRRCSGMKTKGALLDIHRHSEEYPTEEAICNVKRLKFTVQESQAIETMQLKPDTQDGDASAQKTEGSVIQYTKIFSFKKDKKTDKAEKNNVVFEAEKSVKCSLFKSILRKFAPLKESVPNMESDSESISKKFSRTTRRSSRKDKVELRTNDQAQLHVSDTGGWNLVKEAAISESNDSTALTKGCISSESPVNLMPKSCISAMEPGDLSKRIEGNEEDTMNRQTNLDRRKCASLDFSSTGSSTMFESCLDSDVGSTSMDVLSSTDSLEETSRVDSRHPEGVDICALEASCSSGYLSLDGDDNVVKDFQDSPRYLVHHSSGSTASGEAVGSKLEQFGITNDTVQKNCMHQSPALLGNFSVLQISDLKENHVSYLGHMRAEDVKSGKSNSCSREDEEEKNVHSVCVADCLCGENSDVHTHNNSLRYASDSGCFEGSKQLSPVSVLELPIEEETLTYDQGVASIQGQFLMTCALDFNFKFHSAGAARRLISFELKGKHHHLQKFRGCNHPSRIKPLEKETDPWKEPPQSDNLNYTASEENTDKIQMGDCSETSCQPLPFEDEEEMDWDVGGTEKYVRKVLNSSETMWDDLRSSIPLCCDLAHKYYQIQGSTDRDMQLFTGCQPTSHTGNLPSQCLKRKQLPRHARKLLFDYVKEVMESPWRHSGLLTGSWLRECFGPEQLAKTICGQICAWKKVDTNLADEMIELVFKKEGDEWTKFSEEAEEIVAEIEVAIFGLLIDDLVADLAHL